VRLCTTVDKFNVLRRAGVAVTSAAHQDYGPATEEWELIPSSPALLHSHYLGLDGKSVPRLQKAVSAAMLLERRRIFMLSCVNDVSTRISSCALPGGSDWLNDVRSAMDMSDNDVRVAVRLRLGWPLSDLAQPSCPLCGDDMHNSPNPPLGCVKLRPYCFLLYFTLLYSTIL
jgi:hypothetical protein